MLLAIDIDVITHYLAGIITPGSILIPIGLAIFNYRHLNMGLKTILFYLIISGSLNLWAIYESIHHHNNLYILHIYTIVEFLMLMTYFILTLDHKAKKMILVSKIIWVIFPVICVINLFFFQNYAENNSNVRSIEALIFMIYCFNYFYHSSDHDEIRSWGSNSLNWINAGLLIYFSGSIFLFAFANFIISLNLETSLKIWVLVDILIILLYIFIALGFSKCRKLAISMY